MHKSLSSPGTFPRLKPLATAMMLIHTGALANPVFLNSPGNNVTVDQTQPKTTIVKQSSQNAAAYWKEFSIPQDARVQFVQPAADSVIVNTVVGGNPSEILGRLDANGRVFLINPNGIVFGATSVVNVGSLVGSTLKQKGRVDDKPDENGKPGAGEFDFEGSRDSGSILIEGRVNAREIVFIAPEITNRGFLNATGMRASVQLLAAEKVTASITGSDLVFKVEAGHENALIQQLGTVLADGGKIVLLARSMKEGNASVLNMAGVQRADSILIEGDTVRLGGDLNVGLNSGEVQVNAKDVEQTAALNLGSDIEVKADSFRLDHADNSFAGTVSLEVADQATLHSDSDLRLRGRAADLKATASGEVTVSDSQSNSMMLDAASVQFDRVTISNNLDVKAGLIVQTGSLRVGGESNLTADTIDLQNAGNDFKGRLRFTSKGKVSLRDMNDFSVQGDAGQLALKADGSLEQAGSIHVKNETDLHADQVVLKHADNRFGGELKVSAARSVAIHASGDLALGGKAAALDLHSTGDLTLGAVEAGSLDAKAASVRQARPIQVEGTTGLTAETIVLEDADNQFKGLVRLNDAAHASLVAKDRLQVSGQNLSVLKLAASRIKLEDLGPVKELSVVANLLQQTAALKVLGTTHLEVGRAELTALKNDFAGPLFVQGVGEAAPELFVNDVNDLQIQADDLVLGATTGGDLQVQAENLQMAATQVAGHADLRVKGLLSQTGAAEFGSSRLRAAQIRLDHSGNSLNGRTQIETEGNVRLISKGNLDLRLSSSPNLLELQVEGNAQLSGDKLVFGQSEISGDLSATAKDITQTAAASVKGATTIDVGGGDVNLDNEGNLFQQSVSLIGRKTDVTGKGDLRLKKLVSSGGLIKAGGKLLLDGQIDLQGGKLTFISQGLPQPLNPADINRHLPPWLDVFSSKEAVDPVSGLGRITLASPAIEQVSGKITSTADSHIDFHAVQNGSVFLNQENHIQGKFSALAGREPGKGFEYQPSQGASLVAVTNQGRLNVAGPGIDADVVAIHAGGLGTSRSEGSVIRARMPYNNIAAGATRSYPGLTLSIPTGAPQPGARIRPLDFGQPSTGAPDVGLLDTQGPIRVAVGDPSRTGLGGYLDVIPVEGRSLLPSQVIYLEGRGPGAGQPFFYDGARDQNRIPVVYNGSLLPSPQASAALTNAQGALALARQEQTRSVIRTENVAGKVITGVVHEAGPGGPATSGIGAARRPDVCEQPGSGLNCQP